MKNILIIANARRSGGLSGGDNIYENLAKHWGCASVDQLNIDFKPFVLCYMWRIVLALFYALRDDSKYSFVYSASDFYMDSLVGLCYKFKGSKWVAGFYLYAPKENKIYYYSQKIAYWLIKKYADVVCITNDSMKWGFMDKKTVSVHGGVDLSLAGLSGAPKIYDAVFCGRIHHSKGIKEMIDIWAKVIKKKPDAKLAIIGDGDMGLTYIRVCMAKKELTTKNIKLLGYMDKERFDIYKQSKMVLYPATVDHFSMAPVEAMACGCPMITFSLDCMNYIKPNGCMIVDTIGEFANAVLAMIESHDNRGNYYLMKSIDAHAWANTWDWEIRTKKITKEIEDAVSSFGIIRDGGECHQGSIQGTGTYTY